jgi:hypothetical protein
VRWYDSAHYDFSVPRLTLLSYACSKILLVDNRFGKVRRIRSDRVTIRTDQTNRRRVAAA